ncbi:MAG TPA: alpha/beta fold hydrolase [Pirellulales bacterium]|nr:alpha/beta fold hydrolase [Pirellulales bacterium]
MGTKSLQLSTALMLALAPAAWRADGAPPADAGEPKSATSSSEQPPAPREAVAGSWVGTLDAGVKLRIVFNIEQSADGTFKATLDSPDQGAKGIRIDETTFADGELKLTSKALRATFKGKLANGEIAGTFTQGGTALPLALKPAEKAPEIKRPQVPKKPYPYEEREVTVENKPAGVKLAGTLTVPKGDKPFPAVLLISGSGPQDRDESLLGHQPFLVLADYLTRRGIAVLRLDDRGVGGSSGDLATSTTDDLAGDALAAVEFLKSCAEFDPQRIGLVGHSEGGLIAPLAASRSDDVKFIVLIAGPGVTGEEILYAQGELISRAGGGGDAATKFQRALQEKLFAIVKDFERQAAAAPGDMPPDTAEVEKKLVAAITGLSILLPEDKRKAAEAQAQAQARSLVTPWFRYFLSYDPRPTLAKVHCPVLAVIGERDLQVPPAQNLPEIEKALKAAGNGNYTLHELPTLNHLLQTCTTGAPSEYGQIEETMAPSALALIGDWISQQSGH